MKSFLFTGELLPLSPGFFPKPLTPVLQVLMLTLVFILLECVKGRFSEDKN